jgi:hypothetical protein
MVTWDDISVIEYNSRLNQLFANTNIPVDVSNIIENYVLYKHGIQIKAYIRDMYHILVNNYYANY